MIAISGALVFVAAVVLVLGIVLSHIALVYASIGLAIVSAVFLLAGVFQRPPSAEGPQSDGADKLNAQRQPPKEQPAEPQGTAGGEPAAADFEAQASATAADVLVVSGRPRYHVGGCEHVEGEGDAEPLEINEARELGFTPCGVCRPDETLPRGAAGDDQADHADRTAPSTGPAPTAG